MEDIDDSFYTNDTAWPPYKYAAKEIYYVLGSYLAVVGLTGIIGNLLVILVFARYKRLKGPFSILIINLAVGDLVTSILHTMVVISSFKGKWAFGHSGCVLYAFGVGFSGMTSIFTLAAISVERYLVITAKPLSSWKMTSCGAKKLRSTYRVIKRHLIAHMEVLREEIPHFTTTLLWTDESTFTNNGLFNRWNFRTWAEENPQLSYSTRHQVCFCSWIYCSCLTLPPIFGWSKYTTEGVLTSCSWDYKTRTLENTLFYIYLLGFGFAIPLAVIVYCYSFIILAVLAHGKEMSAVSMTQGGVLRRYRVNVDSQSSAIKTAEIILMLIVSFFLSWTPYAVVTLIGHFGPVGWLTPWICTIPAFCAKASVVCNPIVYGWSHPHFKASLKQFLSAWIISSAPSGSREGEDCRRSQPSNHELHYRCFTRKGFATLDGSRPNCSTASTEREIKRSQVRYLGNSSAAGHIISIHANATIHYNVRECSV